MFKFNHLEIINKSLHFGFMGSDEISNKQSRNDMR